MKKIILITLLAIAAITSHAQTCGAKTLAGTACSRKVPTTGAKCYQHGGTTKAGIAPATSATCGAPTKAGGQCKNRVKPGTRCHLHKG